MLAHLRVDLGLEAGAEPDQLEPVTHDLAQFPDLRRGDPCLRQPAQAQQVDQVVGVPLVVLHTTVPPGVPEGVGEVDSGAELLEDVSRPVPPEGRLQDHLRFGAGGRHCFRQGHRAVVDPDLGQDLALRVLPHNHRPAPVQVDPDVLSFHRGLLLSS